MQVQSQKLPNTVCQGLRLFNGRAFYEAHEYFEDAWRDTSGEEREYYRALLQISGGFFRLTQDNIRASKKFFTLAIGWLALFPATFQGLDTTRITANLKSIIHEIELGQSPKRILNQHFQPIIIHNQEY